MVSLAESGEVVIQAAGTASARESSAKATDVLGLLHQG